MSTKLPRCVTSLLLGALLVLQLAAPLACAKATAPSRDTTAATRLAALEQVVGHAVETCHHTEDDGQPAGDSGPCCPCSLCHALSAACLNGSGAYTLAVPVTTGTFVSYPQPPPRHATAPLAFAGPRGPPLLG